METKRVAMMLVTMMIVMGNLLAEAEAQKRPFLQCFPPCLVECKNNSKFPETIICPFSCLKNCILPTLSPSPSPSPSPVFEKIVDQTHDFCKLGCSVHHCASLSTLENPNVEKVAACVDSCSNKCSNNN